MSAGSVRAPRSAERLLGRLLPPGPAREALLGDLAEQHSARSRFPLAAHAWYWWQTISIALYQTSAGARATGPGAVRNAAASGRSSLVESGANDVAFAFRSWRRHSGAAALIVTALAIGIGATTAIFSVVRAVVLQPLPYGDPGTLALVWGATAEAPRGRGALSPPDIMALREESRLFADVAAVNSFGASLSDGVEPEQIQVGVITANFFSVLGVRPLLGRDFVPADDVPMDTRDPRNTSVVILAHDLWARRYGSDPAILGRMIRIGGTPMMVIGVLPKSFRLHMPTGAGMSTDLAAWTPLRIDYAAAPRAGAYLKAVGRLQRGVSLDAAQSELDAVSARFRSEFPAHETAGLRLRAGQLHAEVVGHVTPILAVLSATVGFLLLIACANVANLLLLRLAARERELAVRAALGGSRIRLIRQLITESALLSLVAATVGVAAAWGGIRLLLLMQPADIPRVDAAAIDGAVVGVTVSVAAGCTLLFGLAPAMLASRTDIASALRDRSASVTGAWRRLRNGFVIAEVALSLVLLVGAGLMLRSVAELRGAELGFQPEGTLSFRLSLPFTAYPRPAQWTEFSATLRQHLEERPGVQQVAAASALPVSGDLAVDPFGLDAGVDERMWGARTAVYRVITPNYFETLGISVRAGRGFADADAATAPLVAVVDEALARATWPDGNPVGERITVTMFAFDRGYRVERRVAEVVGIVATVPHGRPDEPPPGTIYLAHPQHPLWAMAVVARADGDPMAIARVAREEVAALDRGLPVYSVRRLDEAVAATLASTRFVLFMVGLFASLAVLLAAVGLYSVVAYAVRQRTLEFGVRLALGARPGQIAARVIREAFLLAVAGIIIGALAAPWLARALDNLLVGVMPGDPLTLACASLIIIAVVTFASWWPAYRASLLNPAEVLRG